MISGTTGISGCVDGSMVLIETKRGSRNAKLHCVGRDIENQEINLVFQNSRWIVTDDVQPRKPDIFPFAIHDFMLEQLNFKGSATELSKLLKFRFNEEFYPNRLTRDLVQHGVELQSYGVDFKLRRSHGKRLIELEYSASGDGSDGRLLWVEITEPTGTRISKTVENTVFECGDGKTEGDGKTSTGDSNSPQIVTMSLDEIIHMSANNIRNRLAQKGIDIPKFTFHNKAT
jgi:hypothetical protein